MRRLRIPLVTALAAASLGLAAAPASAAPCHNDERECPPCYTAQIDAIWEKYTGLPGLFVCPA